MAIYNGPPRGGTRGGKDQFSWDKVKNEGQDKTYYLGYSTTSAISNERWQKGKDVYWYAKEKKDGGSASMTELQAIKAREEELMAQALGLKPKSTAPSGRGKPLGEAELAALIKRDDDDGGPSAGAGAGLFDVDRMRGLGAGRMAVVGTEGATEVLDAEGVDNAEGPPRAPGAPPVKLSATDLKLLQKAMKKQGKKDKKDKKRKDKKQKKHKKAKAKDSNSHSSGDEGPPRGPVDGPPAKRARHDSDSDRSPPAVDRRRQRHDSDEEYADRQHKRRHDSDDERDVRHVRHDARQSGKAPTHDVRGHETDRRAHRRDFDDERYGSRRGGDRERRRSRSVERAADRERDRR